MRKGLVLATLLAVLSVAAPALAQGSALPVPPPIPLTGMKAAELKTSLFGVHLFGTTTEFGMKWDECIEPGGDTLYVTPEGEMQGRLSIARDLACFAYEDTGFKAPQCFVVRRTKDGFSLVSEYGGEVFVTTKVVRGIRTCEKPDLIG